MTTTINLNEINQFQKDSHTWWDETGAFAPLHRVNPVRMAFICEQTLETLNITSKNPYKPLENLKIMDIGCGGGLVCESLARLGAVVTGLDADDQAIDVAKTHAAGQNLTITYQNSAVEDYRKAHPAPIFDVITALEVIEHVDNPDLFLAEATACLKPGGVIFISTLNRTIKSWALGIMAAEYVLGWVPPGTHTWQKFVKPSHLARMMRAQNCTPVAINGIRYSPVTRDFALSKTDFDVNYIMAFKKESENYSS